MKNIFLLFAIPAGLLMLGCGNDEVPAPEAGAAATQSGASAVTPDSNAPQAPAAPVPQMLVPAPQAWMAKGPLLEVQPKASATPNDFKAVTEQLVCRRGGPAPTRLEDLPGTRIRVLAGSSYEETLEAIGEALPELTWSARTAGSAMPLLDSVDAGTIDCTIADSHLADFARRRHPELVVAMNLTEERPLAWAHSGEVEGLQGALASWFAEAHGEGFLEELDTRWFGRFGEFDYVDVARFVRRVQSRLPEYRNAFEDAAESLPFDWEMLAAQAYQESHWDPDAVSATGVRGLMMLTLSTAERVGIEDRRDPFQSIEGGAIYLADLYDRVPEDVRGEDRIWFTLAAYNIGMGHMYDARALAERLGRDKNSWADLAATLPLLSDPQYYETLRYGYARGLEPVRYVEKIREYRAMLDAQGL